MKRCFGTRICELFGLSRKQNIVSVESISPLKIIPYLGKYVGNITIEIQSTGR